MKQYWAEVWDATACQTVTRVYCTPVPERLEYRFDENGFVFSPALEGHELTLQWSVQDAVTWVPLGDNPLSLATKAKELGQAAQHYLRHFEPQVNKIGEPAADGGPEFGETVRLADGGYDVPREFVESLQLEARIYKEVQVPLYDNGYPTSFFPPLTRQLLDAEAAHEEARWDRLRRRYGSKHNPVDSRRRYRELLRRIGAPYFADLDEVNELLAQTNGKED